MTTAMIAVIAVINTNPMTGESTFSFGRMEAVRSGIYYYRVLHDARQKRVGYRPIKQKLDVLAHLYPIDFYAQQRSISDKS